MVTVGGGWGVAEVTAILLAAYFAKNSPFPEVKHTQNAHANKHMNSLLSVAAQPHLAAGKTGK